jgi:hypothetical protein
MMVRRNYSRDSIIRYLIQLNSCIRNESLQAMQKRREECQKTKDFFDCCSPNLPLGLPSFLRIICLLKNIVGFSFPLERDPKVQEFTELYSNWKDCLKKLRITDFCISEVCNTFVLPSLFR